MKLLPPLQRVFRQMRGFTLLELLVVMTIIGILAAMVLNGAGYARTKAARSRTSAEIAALGVALDAYKIDNGEYPQNAQSFSTSANGSTTSYATGATLLYNRLMAPVAEVVGSGTTYKVYFAERKDMVPQSGTKMLIDPFGNPYGYATPDTTGTNTYNPTYDLWSTGGKATGSIQSAWIANFPVE